MISINEERCVRCLECVEVCPVGVIEEENRRPVVKNVDRCIKCYSCAYVCRADAITGDFKLEDLALVEEKLVNKIKKFI